MKYKCVNLLESPSMKQAIILAGNENLDNIVRWYYIAELSACPEDVHNSVRNGDCLIILGEILKDRPTALAFLIEEAAKYNLSAVVVYENKYLKEISNDVIALANDHKTPLILLKEENQPPISDLICEISYRIVRESNDSIRGQHLLMDIMSNNYNIARDTGVLVSTAKYHNFDLTVPHQAMYISNVRLLKNEIRKFEKNSREIINTIQLSAEKVLNHYYKNILSTPLYDSFLILLPNNPYGVSIKKLAEKILSEILLNDKDAKIIIGLGKMCDKIIDFHKSINDAKEVVNASMAIGISNVVKEINDMLMPLFFINSIDNKILNSMVEKNIVPLINIDKSEKFELLKTLKVYFECDKNISIASKLLFVHRNTLANKLQRIEEILNFNLTNIFDCFELQISLYFYLISMPDK